LMILVRPTVLVTVVTLGVIAPWQPSTKLGALKLGAAGHSIVPSGPWFSVLALHVALPILMTCARLVLLPQPSLAVQVRVMILVQPTVLVTVVTLTLTLGWQASTDRKSVVQGAA